MNRLVVFALILISIIPCSAMSLLDAIADDNIYVKIKKIESDNFMFPDKSLVVTILNASDKTISLEIEPGYLLDAEELSASDWAIVDQIKRNIPPNIFTEIGIKGMSLQKHLIEPSKNSYFSCRGEVSNPIKAICEFVYQNNFNNSIGQDALWAINMDQPIHAIDGPDEITIPIKHYIASLLNVEHYHQPADKNMIYVEDGKQALRLLFEFEIDKKDEIKIEILDANEITKNKLVDRKYEHHFNHAIYLIYHWTD